ncbi:phosphotransferase family protein [Peribacillus simplex]|uniref:phosphotransferase family protein n=1 Tax=Peribacillus simplex TaxID=1478 RepID=UPI003D290835
MNLDRKVEQLIQKFNPQIKLLRTWKLHGGVSANVMGMECLKANGQTEKMVLRQYGEVDYRRNPNVAADEYKLLEILKYNGLPVPAPYYFDQSDEIISTPYVVIEFINGEMELTPSNIPNFICSFATILADIHRVNSSTFDVSFLAKQEDYYKEKLENKPLKLDDSLNEGPIRDVLESVWPLPQKNNSVILHGDFWPGNMLWKDGKIMAVIDWEDAALGDPLSDLANSRLEVLWAFGMEAMNNFTQKYTSLMPDIDLKNLPYWDLIAALRPASQLSLWGLEKSKEEEMRERHMLFVTQAFSSLKP